MCCLAEAQGYFSKFEIGGYRQMFRGGVNMRQAQIKLKKH